MDYAEKYRGIINSLIRKSFPDLKREKIGFIEVPKILPFWSFVQKINGKYYIIINKSRRKTNISSLKGQLAHELCHIIYVHSKMGGFKDFFYNCIKFLSELFNTSFSRKTEEKIDKESIKRGYSRDLISRNQEWESLFSEMIVKNLYKRGYLRTEQIKKLIKTK